MVDDIACVAKCGVDSVAANAFINAKTNVKKLQFGVDKCHQLHIGKKSNCCPDLFIDHWEVQKIDSTKTGFNNLRDTKVDENKIKQLNQEKYLGDIISTDRKNMKNLLARRKKNGKGIINQISSIIEDMCHSNVGARENKNIRNHTLILDGIFLEGKMLL